MYVATNTAAVLSCVVEEDSAYNSWHTTIFTATSPSKASYVGMKVCVFLLQALPLLELVNQRLRGPCNHDNHT